MSVWKKTEILMFTEDLNIKRYLSSNIIDSFGIEQMATLNYPNGYGHGTRVHSDCVSLTTNQQPCVKVKGKKKGEKMARIRKLVPLETMKLMGFTREDYQAMRDIGMTDAQIYHCCGDSIVVPTLCMLLGQLFPMSEDELKRITENYIEEIRR